MVASTPERDAVAGRLAVGDVAPHVTVVDALGQPMSLAAAWRGGPVVLTFLRHFG
jgi:peroxiredoxin